MQIPGEQSKGRENETGLLEALGWRENSGGGEYSWGRGWQDLLALIRDQSCISANICPVDSAKQCH